MLHINRLIKSAFDIDTWTVRIDLIVLSTFSLSMDFHHSTVYTEVISIAFPKTGLHGFDDWVVCRACLFPIARASEESQVLGILADICFILPSWEHVLQQ